MIINDLIIQAEEVLISSIEAFFTSKWGATKLWSHDLSHHRRVWNYAKELLQYSEEADQLFIEKLLIACYLHDIGMSIDAGEKHGSRSRIICELFLEETNISPADCADILEAVENHDNKNYSDSAVKNKLLTLVSAADDLDAFGHIGILRYADIYLRRGAQVKDLGRLVLVNSAGRFRNFESFFSNYPELVGKHRQRYMVLKEFYTSLTQE